MSTISQTRQTFGWQHGNLPAEGHWKPCCYALAGEKLHTLHENCTTKIELEFTLITSLSQMLKTWLAIVSHSLSTRLLWSCNCSRINCRDSIVFHNLTTLVELLSSHVFTIMIFAWHIHSGRKSCPMFYPCVHSSDGAKHNSLSLQDPPSLMPHEHRTSDIISWSAVV
jgi:hypothetical protein